MKIIMTGMNGTVAPALADQLRADGYEVRAWSREEHPPESQSAVRSFLEQQSPGWVCHVATGDPRWAEWIAQHCSALGIRLLWTGSVSVFGPSAPAPISAHSIPDATDDYGRYKIECERLVLGACPDAIVARLGWQIGMRPGANTMTSFLTKAAAASDGQIEANRNWTPSCAFLPDTAEALAALLRAGMPGTYHVEGNTAGLSFFDLATGINRMLGAGWSVRPVDGEAQDNRMADSRVNVRQVASRLA